jgi:hypothetical protein
MTTSKVQTGSDDEDSIAINDFGTDSGAGAPREHVQYIRTLNLYSLAVACSLFPATSLAVAVEGTPLQVADVCLPQYSTNGTFLRLCSITLPLGEL